MGHTYKMKSSIINGFETAKVSVVSKNAHFEIIGHLTGFYWVLLSFSVNTLDTLGTISLLWGISKSLQGLPR